MWPQEVKMKVGDRLYCHSGLFIYGFSSINIRFTTGKFYIIKSIDQMKKCSNFASIYDDDNNLIGFAIDDLTSKNHYSNHFYTEQELRKMKLDKLKSSDSYFSQ